MDFWLFETLNQTDLASMLVMHAMGNMVGKTKGNS
jgi:hypothetical protein